METSHTTLQKKKEEHIHFVAKTAKGERLWELRQRIIEAGYSLTLEELEREIEEYKGEKS
jgi:uncharacterized protein YfbU (UPF0304 family)